MLLGDKSSGELHKTQFAHWVSLHCPRLLEGVRQWTLSLLRPHATHSSELSPSNAATAAASVRYHTLFGAEDFVSVRIASLDSFFR